MGRFRFEDYRQPWETGPHWELKREFMEKYCDMFPEDRLLCLAQAYFNIVMMNCRYPDEVMRQINDLAKPLKMRKKFQESDVASGMPEKPEGKRKIMYESFGTSLKQIKFCKEQQDSTNLTQTSTQDNISSAHIDEQMDSHLQQTDSSVTNSNANEVVSSYDYQSEEDEKHGKIIEALGLELIQNMAQEIRNFNSNGPKPLDAILNVAHKLKILKFLRFDIKLEPNCKRHNPIFQAQCYLKNCLISSEKGGSKRKAKFLCADSAGNILMTIATKRASSGINCANKNIIKSDANVAASCSTNFDTSFTPDSCGKNTSTPDNLKLQEQSTEGSSFSDIEASNVMKLLEAIREQHLARTKKKHAVVALNDILYGLKINNYATYDIVFNKSKLCISPHTCKFFLKRILISCETGNSKKDAKISAIQAAFKKIENLSNYEIKNGELQERGNNSNVVFISQDESHTASNIKQPFILNQTLFDASVRDDFVLVDNFALRSLSSRNMKSLLAESAAFCRKLFEYDYEDIAGQITLKRVDVLLDKVIVGTGLALLKEEAKTIACEAALEMLRKKYYTLKVKNEYVEGFIITREQVFQGESFANAALTDSNIGCKMLKNMGWTGGGLGTSGIVEPVEAQCQHSFGQGLGYSKGQCDGKLFKRRIEAMLQDYSKSNSLSDLIFSKDFTKEERKSIHMMAQKYNLHTASRGKLNERYLSVRRKYAPSEILTYLKESGGSNSKYELCDNSVVSQFEFAGKKA